MDTDLQTLGQAIDKLNALRERERLLAVTGITTGYPELDYLTAGLQPGDVVVLTGRPCMGCTTLAMNIAEHVGVDLRMPVLIFTLDTSAPQLALRFQSSRSRVPLWSLRKNRLTNEDRNQLKVAVDALQNTRIQIDDHGMRTVDGLCARARAAHQEHHNLGLIVIDSIEQVVAPLAENRTAESVVIADTLKALAKELCVPVLVLSRLPRRVERRKDRRPMMSDLRELRAIAQVADLIMFLYRDDYYGERGSSPGITEIIVGKNRHWPTGVVHLRLIPECCRFDSLTRQEEGNAGRAGGRHLVLVKTTPKADRL